MIGCVKKSEIKFRKFSVIFEDVSLALENWDMSVGRELNKFMKGAHRKVCCIRDENSVRQTESMTGTSWSSQKGSKVQYKTRTLTQDMHDPNTHSMPSHKNNQVGVGKQEVAKLIIGSKTRLCVAWSR